MTSSVSVQNTSEHSMTASKVIVIFSQSVLIYCAQIFLNSFHFTRTKLSFPNKRKLDVTSVLLVQMKANQHHLLGFRRFFPEIVL